MLSWKEHIMLLTRCAMIADGLAQAIRFTILKGRVLDEMIWK